MRQSGDSTAMAKKRGGIVSGIFTFLFGLPFLAVGIGATGYFFYVFWQFTEAQRWVETPAQVLSAELLESTGDDSTTYRAAVEYRYSFNGQDHTSNRVGLIGGSDNFGSWQQDKYQLAYNHLRNGEPILCYVNPADPSQSLLFRDLRVGIATFILLFAVLFGGAGAAITLGALFAIPKVRAQAAKQAAAPEEPWLWNPEWASGRIVSSTHKNAWFLVTFAAFWLLISAPVAAIIPAQAIKEQEYPLLVLMAFPVLGLVMLVSGMVSVARARRYGHSVLVLHTPTGLTGGYLSGTVEVPKPVEAPQGVMATLKCVDEKTEGTGKNRRTSTHTLWQDEQNIAPQVTQQFGNEGTLLPVQFAIPAGLPSTDAEGNERIRWTLKLEARTAGLDYTAEFHVPVFAAPGDAGAPAAPPPAPEGHLLPLDPRIVRVEFFKDGALFTYPRGRHLWGGFFLLGFSAFFGVFLPLLYLHVHMFFTAIWAAAVVLMLLGSFGLLLNEKRADVKAGVLEITNDYFFFRRRKTIVAADIAEFITDSNMRIGDEDIYRIQVKTRSGKSHTAGSGFRSRRMGEQVAELMKQSLGLAPAA